VYFVLFIIDSLFRRSRAVDVLNDEGRHVSPGLTDDEYRSFLADKFEATEPQFEQADVTAKKLAGIRRREIVVGVGVVGVGVVVVVVVAIVF
jgi:hypothetical protein